VLQELEKLPTKTNNQSVNASIDSLMSKLQLALFSKQQCFAVCGEKFSGLLVQRAKVNAELDWARIEQRRLAGNEAGVKVPPGVSHPELYRQISVWRDKLAAERNVGPQAVFPNATLRELVEVLPVELAALKRVYGIGKNRLEWFGTELCELIAKFCAKAGISGLTAAAATANLPPSSSATSHRYKLSETQQMTLDLWRAGLSLDQIASQRSLSKTTIEGHLAEAVALGLTTIEGLISPEDVTEILTLVTAKPTEVLSEIKAHFADKYSYGQIKIALNSRKPAS
jgi:ribonuclease D